MVLTNLVCRVSVVIAGWLVIASAAQPPLSPQVSKSPDFECITREVDERVGADTSAEAQSLIIAQRCFEQSSMAIKPEPLSQRTYDDLKRNIMKVMRDSAYQLLLIRRQSQRVENNESANGSQCKIILITHGFLSRAQFQCKFSRYSADLKKWSSECASEVGEVSGKDYLLDGMRRFDALVAKRGATASCRQVLTQFSQDVAK